MAIGFPDSKFVGIDLAPSQVAHGQRAIAELGVTNLELRAMSIADVTRSFGEFDYIICHGVYSWVPPEVQDAILRVCSENLSPSGIAYVSYNVLPGWHLRRIAREMMLYQDNSALPSTERVARARSFAETIAKASGDESIYSAALAHEVELFKKHGDGYFLHEQLEPFNEPIYFSEFSARASARGLGYVAEARIGSNPLGTPPWVSTALGGQSADWIRVQQCIDFVQGTAFRRTLLCHDSLSPRPTPDPSALRDTHFLIRSVPVKPSDEEMRRSGGTAEAFRSPDDAVMTTNNPAVITMLRALLRAAPGVLSFKELEARVLERLQMDRPPGVVVDDSQPHGLEAALLQCVYGGVVEIVHRPHPVGCVLSERPIAPTMARHHAAQGSSIPNLRHYMVEISGFERLILIHLDGTNSRDSLLSIVESAIADGRLSTGDERPDRANLASAIDEALGRFKTAALLAPEPSVGERSV